MPGTWRQRQKAALRQQLYDASVELFRTQGYESTSVQQITEQVGVAKGTFFKHFPSKEHVVVQWYDGITERALRAARSRRAARAEHAIAEFFADMAGQATGDPELLIAKASHSAHPLLIAAEKAQAGAIDGFVRERCEVAIEDGELDATVDVEALCGLLVAVLTGTSRGWVTSDPRFDFSDVIRQRVSFLFRALRAR